MDKIDFKRIFDESLDDLTGLLKIHSVYDQNTADERMPYGLNVHKAFEYMRDLAIRDGFNVREYDGHALSFSHGEGKERIDIASHLDVVAAKDEDFNIRIEDGKLFGRGTSDMKVPMFLTYLSLKILKERYPKLNREMRIVLGMDEERTMEDMKHYVSVAGYPDFAFTPDGFFPMGIGEKGAIMWTIRGEYKGIIKSLEAGSQCNIISPIAKCRIKANDIDRVKKYIAENDIDGKAELVDDMIDITIKGRAAHASTPFLGHSATNDLLKLMADLYDDAMCKNLYKTYGDHYGRGFESYVSEDPYECLSVNLGVFKINDGKAFGQVDCRYPFKDNAKELTSRLSKASDLDVSLDYNDDPTECSEDDPYVKVMLKTYRGLTGDESRPIISGGVSYSKVFKHCVSFGPITIDKPSVAHCDGEFVYLDDCLHWFEIYYRTIENLALMEEQK